MHTTHRLTEDNLTQREYERQAYREMADASRAVGLVDTKAEQRARAVVIQLASHQRVGTEAAQVYGPARGRRLHRRLRGPARLHLLACAAVAQDGAAAVVARPLVAADHAHPRLPLTLHPQETSP